MERQSRNTGLTWTHQLDQAGLKPAFDEAARSRGRSAMIQLLTQAGCPDANWLADMIVANPRRYGY